jgi:hypothetical protein
MAFLIRKKEWSTPAAPQVFPEGMLRDFRSSFRRYGPPASV